MIALFGGSFDPVHLGHIHNADLVYKHCNIRKFIVLPCGKPAHKNNLLFSEEQRLELLQLALKDYSHLEVSTFEFNNQTNYTIDTLRHFAQQYGVINFVMGSDSFLDLPTWDEFEKFHTLTNIIIINRNDKISDYYQFEVVDTPQQLENGVGKVYCIDNDFIDISSTLVRTTIQQGGDISAYVLPAVREKINEYRN